jgi:UDP-N-acetyl-D-glucosamine dehydrogenase
MRLFVIGLGYVGLPLALEAVKKGIKVTGFDNDTTKIARLNQGYSDIPNVFEEDLVKYIKIGDLTFIDKLPQQIENSIYVIAVPTPLNNDLKPDVSYLEKACDYIASSIGRNCLVINESTSFIGTLRHLIKPRIDKASGIQNIKYAVAPERIDPGNAKWNVTNTPRVIAGLTRDAEEAAESFYSKFCSERVIVSSPEVAEAAKLLENTFRQVNIALVNEFSDVLYGFGVSSHEAISAAATKPFGFTPFLPSIGVGGHCIPIDPTYLSYSGSRVNVKTSLIDISNEINFNRFRSITTKIEDKYGSSLSKVKIQVAGIAYKVGVSDIRESPALKLISELRRMGSEVSWHDPLVKAFRNEESSPLNSNIDLGLIVTPHDEIDFSVWNKANINVFDLSSLSLDFGWQKFF